MSGFNYIVASELSLVLTLTYSVLHVLRLALRRVLAIREIPRETILKGALWQNFHIFIPFFVAECSHIILKRELSIVDGDDGQQDAEEGEFTQGFLLR